MAIFFTICIIVVVIYMIYLLKRKKHTRITTQLNKSNGTMDAAAANVLDLTVREPHGENNFIAGEILELNMVIGGNEGKTKKNELIMQTAANLYSDAITDIIHDIGNYDIYRPEFIIDHVEHFAEVNELQVNDIPIAKAKVLSTRINDAKAISTDNKLDTIDNYIDISKTHTSDQQNVHDSAVNIGLRNTLKTIREEAPVLSWTVVRKQIADYIADCELSNAKKQLAYKALEYINIHNETNYTMGETESNICKWVWCRALIPKNEDTADNIKLALCNALADFYTESHDHPVCSNGRCARLIEALTLVDNDKTMGKVQTREMYRNEIFDKCRKIIDKVVEDSLNDSDENIVLVARSYTEDIPIDTPELQQAEQTLHSRMKKIIDVCISKYSDRLSESDIKNITTDCHAAVSF